MVEKCCGSTFFPLSVRFAKWGLEQRPSLDIRIFPSDRLKWLALPGV